MHTKNTNIIDVPLKESAEKYFGLNEILHLDMTVLKLYLVGKPMQDNFGIF